MTIKIKKDSELQPQKQIELAAEQLAQILIQQIEYKNTQTNKKIEGKNG